MWRKISATCIEWKLSLFIYFFKIYFTLRENLLPKFTQCFISALFYIMFYIFIYLIEKNVFYPSTESVLSIVSEKEKKDQWVTGEVSQIVMFQSENCTIVQSEWTANSKISDHTWKHWTSEWRDCRGNKTGLQFLQAGDNTLLMCSRCQKDFNAAILHFEFFQQGVIWMQWMHKRVLYS